MGADRDREDTELIRAQKMIPRLRRSFSPEHSLSLSWITVDRFNYLVDLVVLPFSCPPLAIIHTRHALYGRFHLHPTRVVS